LYRANIDLHDGNLGAAFDLGDRKLGVVGSRPSAADRGRIENANCQSLMARCVRR
jgi:hypothetical protein